MLRVFSGIRALQQTLSPRSRLGLKSRGKTSCLHPLCLCLLLEAGRLALRLPRLPARRGAARVVQEALPAPTSRQRRDELLATVGVVVDGLRHTV